MPRKKLEKRKEKVNKIKEIPSVAKIAVRGVSEASEITEAEVEKEVVRQVRRLRCAYCQNKSNPSFTDSSFLRRFISDRSKIYPKIKSGLCSKHQRRVARQIKYARFLSILPYITKV